MLRKSTPRLGRPAALLGVLVLGAAPAAAQAPVLSSNLAPPIQAGSTFNIVLTGQPGHLPIFFISQDPGPTPTPFGDLQIGIGPPPFPVIFGVGAIPAGGVLTVPCPTTCGDLMLIQEPFYLQAMTFDFAPISFAGFTNQLVVDFVAGTCATPCIRPAVPDSTISSSQFTHCFYMPGIGTDFVFDPPGVFNEFDDGTATMSGTIVRSSDPCEKFDVDVTFTQRQSLANNNGVFPPAGSPKQSLDPSVYIENGGPVDPSEWHYYLTTDGTLTGQCDFEGGVITFTRRGPAFQVGIGANDKNLLYGASGWFDAITQSQPTAGPVFPSTFNGDTNIELSDDCP